MSSIRLLFLGMTALAGLIDVSNTQDITSDTFFYGQSPPVYPSRKPTLLPALLKFSNTHYLSRQLLELELVTGLSHTKKLRLW
jgi:hypothetical protein